MFTRMKESELYKLLSKVVPVKYEKEKDIKNNEKKKVKNIALYPDAIWHRSKSTRFRRD